ncbi:MAG: hypothetical protein FWD47_11830 [Treponema sp.]|nr:hypothetical protein [Treponema sp.]
MPYLEKIEKTMIKERIPQEIIKKLKIEHPVNNDPKNVIAVIERMDKLLSDEQRFAVMEKQGCCKSGQRDRDCKAFGIEHKNKPLAEKIKLLSGIQYMMIPRLNKDNTITVSYGGNQNGIHTGKTTCSCGQIKELKQPFSVTPTFCGCCAGHFLYHYQNALGIKLKLKEIVSSPLNTNGEKPCEFKFEIVDSKNQRSKKSVNKK